MNFMEHENMESGIKRTPIERTTISQKKSKTTEAVANRGVDTDAPRGENEDQKQGRMKNFEMHKIREKWNAIYNT